MNLAYLSIGSNQDPEKNLHNCIRLLHQYCSIIKISPVYETEPVADAPKDRRFLNAVIAVETGLDIHQLKQNIREKVEAPLGRQREPVNDRANIPIDVDILLYNHEIHDLGKHQVPDAAIYRHAYVIIPLADVAPDYIHPVTGERIRDIALRFTDSTGIAKRDDIHLE